MNISSTSFAGQCTAIDCSALGVITVLRPAAGEPRLYLCTHHYHKLVKRLRERGQTEDDAQGLTNAEIRALISNNEFRQIIAKLVADEEFKQVVRKAVKRNGKC
jgi:hypothetical protein